ncbi:MAG: UDP-2,3-diacylglucosamine diphosphatase [Flavobacteriia bacterium]|jgi:UDP-2,3-diacylglucosamine hydrolase|nr:UDP-2,3-diacylglucosamine diphosphatase [Flavobacteriia bacterium]NBX38434.1 UDP-2,3-diacylglucosamine diphosphatase [Flavobacteriia bacterium]
MSVAYFASDFHLGAPNSLESKEREKTLVAWLEHAAKDATDIYLVGDVFDFWFEYKQVIPKGYTRLLGTLARISDQGIQLHFFHGNHDMWVKSYFTEEFNMHIYPDAISLQVHGKKILVGHGDGLGPGDLGYKLIKGILRNPLCQWTFARLHPNFGIGLAKFFSGTSRNSQKNEHEFLGKEREWLYQYALEHQQTDPHDFYIFGHRHLPLRMEIPHGVYYNLGEWITFCTYLRIDEESTQFLQWMGTQAQVYEPLKHA